MSGLLWVLAVSMLFLAGTQSASLADGPLGMNYFKLAKWLMEKNGATQHKPQQGPQQDLPQEDQSQELKEPATTTAPPRLTMLYRHVGSETVMVYRDAYVELKCPVKGSPVTWTVISGQYDGIHAEQMLVFTRMTGAADQEYQCQASSQVASLHVHILDDIPYHRTDAVSSLCEHGRLCPISCGEQAKWDGVTVIKENWISLQDKTEPRFIGNGIMSADMFTTPSRMACNYVYSITEKGAVESGLPLNTELHGQKKVYNVTINPPRPHIVVPLTYYSQNSVKAVCIGKPATIRCDGLLDSNGYKFSDMYWLETTGDTTKILARDPSRKQADVESMISTSILGTGKATELTFSPVKLEHLRSVYVCKLQNTQGSAFAAFTLVHKASAC